MGCVRTFKHKKETIAHDDTTKVKRTSLQFAFSARIFGKRYFHYLDPINANGEKFKSCVEDAMYFRKQAIDSIKAAIKEGKNVAGSKWQEDFDESFLGLAQKYFDERLELGEITQTRRDNNLKFIQNHFTLDVNGKKLYQIHISEITEEHLKNVIKKMRTDGYTRKI